MTRERVILAIVPSINWWRYAQAIEKGNTLLLASAGNNDEKLHFVSKGATRGMLTITPCWWIARSTNGRCYGCLAGRAAVSLEELSGMMQEAGVQGNKGSQEWSDA